MNAVSFLPYFDLITFGAIAGLVVLFWVPRWKRFFLPYCFFLVVGIIVGEPLLRTWAQYQVWHTNPAGKYFLPPHQPWSYFAGYVFIHFWFWRSLGIVVAGIVFVLAEFTIVRPSQGFRMNRGEALLIAFGITLAGWPYLLVYLVALLLLYTAILALFEFRFRMVQRSVPQSSAQAATPPEPPRFPVALPATLALLVIPFAHWLIMFAGLGVLRVTNLSV